MQVDIYNTENKKVDTMDLPDGVFGVRWNADLVHQVVTAQMANKRSPWAHTKDRGDVRGGGKKPWRQKGTGRARHGSRRSPIWTGGGVTFGPTNERNYTQKINKKMKTQALCATLSKKLKENEIKIIDNFNITDNKTKAVAGMLKNVCDVKDAKAALPSTLMVTKTGARSAVMAGRNIAKNSVSFPNSLNLYDCLAHQCIIFEKPALEEFIKRYDK